MNTYVGGLIQVRQPRKQLPRCRPRLPHRPTTTETEHVTGLAKPFQAAGNGKKRAAPLTSRSGRCRQGREGTCDVWYSWLVGLWVGLGGAALYAAGPRLNTVF